MKEFEKFLSLSDFEEFLLEKKASDFLHKVASYIEEDESLEEKERVIYENIYGEGLEIKKNCEKWVTDLILLHKKFVFRDFDNIKIIIEYINEGETIKREEFIRDCTDNYNISKLEELSEQTKRSIRRLQRDIELSEEVFCEKLGDEKNTRDLKTPKMMRMLEEVQKIIRLKKQLLDLSTEIDNIINEQSNTATNTSPEPDLIDFSEGTDAKTKLAILYELGIFDYLREKAYPINSANKIASLLSAIIGGEAKNLQTYINPIISPDTDQRNAPKKIHKEKARLILQKLGYIAKKL